MFNTHTTYRKTERKIKKQPKKKKSTIVTIVNHNESHLTIVVCNHKQRKSSIGKQYYLILNQIKANNSQPYSIEDNHNQ